MDQEKQKGNRRRRVSSCSEEHFLSKDKLPAIDPGASKNWCTRGDGAAAHPNTHRELGSRRADEGVSVDVLQRSAEQEDFALEPLHDLGVTAQE